MLLTLFTLQNNCPVAMESATYLQKETNTI
jgi:hypothetical protein